MSSQSPFLQSSWGQVVDSTFENSSMSSASLYFQQILQVPKKGPALEKSSWRTAVIIGFSLVSLLLTAGCSPTLRDPGGHEMTHAETHPSGDTTVSSGHPVTIESLPFSPDTSGAANSSGPLASADNSTGVREASSTGSVVSSGDYDLGVGDVAGGTANAGSSRESHSFSERRNVIQGWLRFVRQEKAADAIARNLLREASGESLPIMDVRISDPELAALVAAPNVNRSEFKRWRQLLAAPSLDNTKLNVAALMLTTATSPDEIQNIDLFYVDAESGVSY